MADDRVRTLCVVTLCVVYEGREAAPLDAEILHETADRQDALAYARAHGGTVYAYEVTDHDDLTNETLVDDGT